MPKHDLLRGRNAEQLRSDAAEARRMMEDEPENSPERFFLGMLADWEETEAEQQEQEGVYHD